MNKREDEEGEERLIPDETLAAEGRKEDGGERGKGEASREKERGQGRVQGEEGSIDNEAWRKREKGKDEGSKKEKQEREKKKDWKRKEGKRGKTEKQEITK